VLDCKTKLYYKYYNKITIIKTNAQWMGIISHFRARLQNTNTNTLWHKAAEWK